MKKEGIKIEYHQAEKLSWKDFINTIPKEFIPGKVMAYSFVTIFLIVIVFGIILLPWGNFTNFSSISTISSNIEIKIGIPWNFFKINLLEPSQFPLKFSGLFLDLIVYLIFSYIINIAWNAFASMIKKQKIRKGITTEYKFELQSNQNDKFKK